MKLLSLFFLAVAGCASTRVMQVSGPDGTRDWYVIQCPSTAKCMNQSARTCGGKYDVMARQQLASGRLVLVPAPGFVVGGSSRGKQEFVVHCRYDDADGDDGGDTDE